MLNQFERAFDANDQLSFHDHLAATRVSRKTIAQKFYTLLVLKKLQTINVDQDEPYGDIQITKSDNFNQLQQQQSY